MKNWQISKNKKIGNLVVSKPETYKRLKTAIETKFCFSRMKMDSFFADTKLQIDQITKKIEEISLSLYLFKN